MELDSQQTESAEQGRGYPPGRFNLLLAMVAVILTIIGIAQITGTRAVEPSGLSESVLQGDISAKTAHFYDSYFPTLKAEIEDLRSNAIKRYKASARQDPSPEVYRRLIIVSGGASGNDTASYINHLERLGPGRIRRTELVQEASMWRAIYLGRLSRADADRYARQVRDLDLGWFEHVAAGDLYASAGLAAKAQAEQDLAKRSAAEMLVMLTLLAVVMVCLGFLGIGLLIWYAGKKRRGKGSADLPSASPDPVVRSNVAGHLLESFVAYMLAIIVVQLCAAAVLDLSGIALTAMGEVILTVAVYVLSGLVALDYLGKRLRAAGLAWQDIGLKSRRPLIDVLSGIGAYAAALPLVLLSAVVVQWLSRYVQSPENPIVPLFVESESWIAKLALFLLAVVAAPFFEELFFRGVLFSSIRARWGVVTGVVISAVVFGMVHPLPIGLLPILVLGGVFALVFNERGSLLSNMVAHACNNAVAFTLLFILTG